MYEDDLHVVGIMTVRVFSKAKNSFKCGASIKFKQKRYLGPLFVQLIQVKLDGDQIMLQKKIYELSETDTEANFNAIIDLESMRNSQTIELKYIFKGSEATDFKILHNKIRLPITQLKFLNITKDVSSTGFVHSWQKMTALGNSTLLETSSNRMDTSMFMTCHDLSYYFKHVLLLSPCKDVAEACGLIYQDCHSHTVAMVKIRIKPHNMFDIQLLCNDTHAITATDIGRQLTLALAAIV